MQPSHLETERLLLRRWRDSDRPAFAALNADPFVMEHFMAPLTRDESDTFVDRIEEHFEQHEWGLWAVEVKGGAPFIGYVGLWPAKFLAPFTPAVEIGWRLAHEHWGRGYAPEAAAAAVADGFSRLDVEEIVSFTAVGNDRSMRVMEKIGMRRDDAGDFEHPSIPEGHRVRPHVLYRLRKPG